MLDTISACQEIIVLKGLLYKKKKSIRLVELYVTYIKIFFQCRRVKERFPVLQNPEVIFREV